MFARLQAMHHLVDYALGTLLLVGPWLFGFSESFTGMFVTILFGFGLLAASYLASGHGFPRRVGYSAHLLGETVGGGLLIGAPWIFGFSAHAWVPHVVIGIVIAARGLLGAVGVAALEEAARTDGDNARRAHL
jgi:hypothetical protein